MVGVAHSAEAYGTWNECRANFMMPSYDKSKEQRIGLFSALENCVFFTNMEFLVCDWGALRGVVPSGLFAE